jgi:hypothetical protein
MVLKNLFFAGILKVNDENSRIRIHPKMSWIWNTDWSLFLCVRYVLLVTGLCVLWRFQQLGILKPGICELLKMLLLINRKTGFYKQ